MDNKKTSKVKMGKRTYELHRIAHYAFFVGLVIAILSGLKKAKDFDLKLISQQFLELYTSTLTYR